MRITATQIEQWANRPEFPGLLPVLVRRLIGATATLTELSIRGADSLNFPGWDGEVNVSTGSAWVPEGRSRWELGCSANPAAKANRDFTKRSNEFNEQFKSENHFVFVSPRRWNRKQTWRDEVTAESSWRSIRAYDADDLEAWLEAAPGVALWLAGLMGVAGHGIESIEGFWDRWSKQSKLTLTPAAIGEGREVTAAEFSTTLAKRPSLIVLTADSAEEAAAFVCKELLNLGHADSAACVTTAEGWRFAEENAQLRILVAASSEVAMVRAPQEGTVLIVPSVLNAPGAYSASSINGDSRAECVTCRRPDAAHFEKALIGLGEAPADAARLTVTCGRSWSVYRRLMAKNPAISKPTWLSHSAARCLSAVVLVGCWNQGKSGDVAALTAITAKSYEDLERDLLELSKVDDSPVLKIGHVWKAKAPLELLYLYAPRITQDEWKRFLDTAQAILVKPDPALELKPEQRWMASVYGKVREESGMAIKAIADSLAKLRVYAERGGDHRLSVGVDDLIRSLLIDADRDRWLSLVDVLQPLAEASPEVFLASVESSLKRSDAPVRCLFSETGTNSAFSRFWHASLLWALELLAWSPRHLAKCADILAQLMAFPLPDNIGNKPSASLVSLFRPWWPQTTASERQRMAVLDRLIQNRNEVAWSLLSALVPRHSQVASANAKPRWRDDDAGGIGPESAEGFGSYSSGIITRLIAQAQDVPARIAELVDHLVQLGDEIDQQIVGLIRSATSFYDEDRVAIRNALRKWLSWRSTFGKDERSQKLVAQLRPLFDVLAPDDLVMRHTWLFANGWAELPDGRGDDWQEADKVRNELRAHALREIFDALGWDGVERLIQQSGNAHLTGWQVASTLPKSEVLIWALKRFSDLGAKFHDPVLVGVCCNPESTDVAHVLERAVSVLDVSQLPAFASCLQCARPTWDFIEKQVSEAQKAYWENVRPGWLNVSLKDLEYVVDRLVEAGRIRTAFHVIEPKLEEFDALRLMALLEGLSAGAEPQGPLPDSWHIQQALKVIEGSTLVTRRQVALLEFRYFEALRFQGGARNLYAEMLEDPTLFVECVCIVFRPRNQPIDEQSGDVNQAAANAAWSVLHDGRGMPGQQGDGQIDYTKFDVWIREVRALSATQDRSDVTDSIIGQWLSSCPADSDGTWPCLAVRDLLDGNGAETIRRGFHTGVLNNRGVHSHAMGEGGGQERGLAARYRSFAERVMINHPNVANILEAVARSYDSQAKRQDDDAALIGEGVS